MTDLRFLSGGESHGVSLVGILEGFPAGVSIERAAINQALADRQKGYGRGERMRIERDQVQILSGIRFGKSTGAPIAFEIANRDYANWQHDLSAEPILDPVTLRPPMVIPRPGHADLAGVLKYQLADIRDVLERASARSTAILVAAGAIVKKLLQNFEICFSSFVTQIGVCHWENRAFFDGDGLSPIRDLFRLRLIELQKKVGLSEVRCPDPSISAAMIQAIDTAQEKGDTVGGSFWVVIGGVPVGLGSYVHWDRRLDGALAQAIMSLQGIKAVEIGLGHQVAHSFGSEVHDPIYYQAGTGYYRRTNRAGGIEGGVSNGEPIILQAAMKPIPTLGNPLASVHIGEKKAAVAAVVRADVCAVPAASLIGEAAAAITLGRFFLEKFGGDSLAEITANYRNYMAGVAT